MALGKLNFSGYIVASATVCTLGAVAVGRTELALPFVLIAVGALWRAMYRNRERDGANAGPTDGKSDDGERQRRREGELESQKGGSGWS